jgi:large subunit ribosomal protein L13
VRPLWREPGGAASGNRRVGHRRAPKKFDKKVHVRTYSPKASDVTETWHVIDATDVVLGRLASQAATLLRGKHRPTFAPHADGGDHVIIVNAAKVALTGAKATQKIRYRHSGYIGGLKSVPLGEALEKDPRGVVEDAIRGMLPKTRLGRSQFGKLKVYAGADHPHAAQKPQPFTISQVAQ